MKDIRWGLLALLLFLFQNCGEFTSAHKNVFYPYKTRPDFFYDIKLVGVDVDSARRENYHFDVAVSYAKNPSQSVNYRLAFSTLNFTGVCDSIDGTAHGNQKHFRVQCLMPTADDLYIQLTLVGPDNEQMVEQMAF